MYMIMIQLLKYSSFGRQVNTCQPSPNEYFHFQICFFFLNVFIKLFSPSMCCHKNEINVPDLYDIKHYLNMSTVSVFMARWHGTLILTMQLMITLFAHHGT